VNSLQATSYYTTGVSVKSYSDNTLNTPAKMIWGSESYCDTKYWSSKTDCNGVATPWGYGKITDFVTGEKGSVRAWHFLADEKADVT